MRNKPRRSSPKSIDPTTLRIAAALLETLESQLERCAHDLARTSVGQRDLRSRLGRLAVAGLRTALQRVEAGR